MIQYLIIFLTLDHLQCIPLCYAAALNVLIRNEILSSSKIIYRIALLPTWSQFVKLKMALCHNLLNTATAAYEMAHKYNVEMPIVEEAYNILYNGRNAREAVLLLMTREKREEK